MTMKAEKKEIVLPPGTRRVINVHMVAAKMGCGWRHILRMADAKEFPWGFKLGSLRRWDEREVDEFIASGGRVAS
jgi:predicted DNA-binding transcriptional regulator AlpA